MVSRTPHDPPRCIEERAAQRQRHARIIAGLFTTPALPPPPERPIRLVKPSLVVPPLSRRRRTPWLLPVGITVGLLVFMALMV